MCGMWHSPEEFLSAVYSQSKYLFCRWKCTIGALHNFIYGRWPDLYAVSFIVDLQDAANGNLMETLGLELKHIVGGKPYVYRIYSIYIWKVLCSVWYSNCETAVSGMDMVNGCDEFDKQGGCNDSPLVHTGSDS